MSTLLALAVLLLVFTPAAAQEPVGSGADSLPDSISYTVKPRWSGRFRKGNLKIELTVVNESSAPVEVAFRTSARVCGTLHDSKDKAYYRFPEAAAQVVGAETFPPGKKRILRHEIPVEDLRKAPPDVNAVSAWLCGYETVRAWAEFDMPVFAPDE